MLKQFFAALLQLLVLSAVNAGQDSSPIDFKLINSIKETNTIDIIDGLCSLIGIKHNSKKFIPTVRCRFTRVAVYKSPHIEKFSQWEKKENYFPPLEERNRLLKEMCANLDKDLVALNTEESLERQKDDIAGLKKICNDPPKKAFELFTFKAQKLEKHTCHVSSSSWNTVFSYNKKQNVWLNDTKPSSSECGVVDIESLKRSEKIHATSSKSGWVYEKQSVVTNRHANKLCRDLSEYGNLEKFVPRVSKSHVVDCEFIIP